MSKKNQKHEHQSGQQPTPQPTAPATPLELSDEELEHVVGGTSSGGDRPTESLTFQPDPTAVE